MNIFSFSRYFQKMFQSGCTILYYQEQYDSWHFAKFPLSFNFSFCGQNVVIPHTNLICTFITTNGI